MSPSALERHVAFDEREIVIGRVPGSDLVLDNVTVARRHVRLVPEGGRWIIEDLGSHCGFQINEERVGDRHVLRDGDVIRIGQCLLEVESGAGG